MTTGHDEMVARAAALACWRGAVTPEPLPGGITNHNFLVSDLGERFIVRIGDDIPVLHVMRFNELAASRAAAAAGLSPELVHHEPGAIVIRFIEGNTLTAEDARSRAMLERLLKLVRRCHREVAGFLRGPVLVFWVFHVLRDYAVTLRERGSLFMPQLPRLMQAAGHLERLVGPIDLVFSHNDLLASNVIDDGQRLWLIDWDYAGFNSSLFDLGNLCSNSDVDPADEDWLVEAYFDRPIDAALKCRYQAMKCASLLREALWGMVSQVCSSLDFDYLGYAGAHLARFERAYAELR
ncbi:MAG: phosphotransferase [Acetobacteraceae bacterium]